MKLFFFLVALLFSFPVFSAPKHDIVIIEPSNGDTLYLGDSITVRIHNNNNADISGAVRFDYIMERFDILKTSVPSGSSLFDFQNDTTFKICLPESLLVGQATFYLIFIAPEEDQMPVERRLTITLLPRGSHLRYRPEHSGVVVPHSPSPQFSVSGSTSWRATIVTAEQKRFDLTGRLVDKQHIVPLRLPAVVKR